MNKEVISDRQGVALIFLFIIGESSILVTGISAKKDLWLAIILAMIISFFLMLLYGKLFNFNSNMNLFDTFEIVFGKFIGKTIIVLYVLYAYDLAILVLVDFGQFISTVNFNNTPLIVPMIFIGILCAMIVKEGIISMGRWGEIFFIIIIAFILFTVLLLIPNMNLNNIIPIFSKGIKPIIKGAYEVFIYPFGETVIFTVAFSVLKNNKSIYKIYFQSLLIGGIFLIITSVSIILVLGVDNASSVYYPAYDTVARIDILDTFQRIEAIVAIVYVLGGFIKISIYLLATCKGIAKLFKCKDYRLIVTPITLLMVIISNYRFTNPQSFSKYIFNVWIYYAFIFIAILPLITLITIKIRKGNY